MLTGHCHCPSSTGAVIKQSVPAVKGTLAEHYSAHCQARSFSSVQMDLQLPADPGKMAGPVGGMAGGQTRGNGRQNKVVTVQAERSILVLLHWLWWWWNNRTGLLISLRAVCIKRLLLCFLPFSVTVIFFRK